MTPAPAAGLALVARRPTPAATPGHGRVGQSVAGEAKAREQQEHGAAGGAGADELGQVIEATSVHNGSPAVVRRTDSVARFYSNDPWRAGSDGRALGYLAVA